ncbi:MAG: cysteine hydrolase [Clostridia bacterium]|nr:cysteine hydrolase [Clostridia bacterium]
MKCLIVVDMQKGFMYGENYQNLSKKIDDMLDKSNYEKVFYTKFVNLPNSLYITKLKWNKLLTKEEQELCVKVVDNSKIFTKYGYGLEKNDLLYFEELKKNNDLESIDICGLQTDACVYAIAFQMFDLDIYPNILLDYCETNEKIKSAIKDILARQF